MSGVPGNLWDRLRDRATLWRCPCGYEGDYRHVVSHRKGWKRRPECTGAIFALSQATPEVGGQSLPSPSDDPPADPEGPDPSSVAFAGLDPEAIARILNRRREGLPPESAGDRGDAQTTGPSTELPFGGGRMPWDRPTARNGAGFPAADMGLGSSLPAGDYRFVPPGPEPEITLDRIGVTLPAIALTMYDWARGEGWGAGDGTFSAFVWDVLTDHFHHCWRRRIVVIENPEEESVA